MEQLETNDSETWMQEQQTSSLPPYPISRKQGLLSTHQLSQVEP
jgi:hypothetical protein